MNIKYAKQIEIKDLKLEDISLFLFAVNHEKRSFTAYDEINRTNKIKKSIGLVYNDYSKIVDNGVMEKQVIQTPSEISKLLDREFDSFQSENIQIVIDYSCMTK